MKAKDVAKKKKKKKEQTSVLGTILQNTLPKIF